MAMNLTLKQIRAFVAVARLGSATRAAEQLHVTQSAISLLIRDLEEKSEVQLFEHGRALILTEAGQEFLHIAERIIGDVDQAVDNLNGLATKARGKVAIAAGVFIASTILPPVLKIYRERFPNIELRVRDMLSTDLAGTVLRGEVDFAVGTDANLDRSMLSVQSLRHFRLGAFFPQGHPLESRKTIRWRDLKPWPIIVVNPLNALWQRAMAMLYSEGITLEVAFEVTFPSTAMAMAREGFGVVIQPSYAIPSLAMEGVVGRALNGPAVESDVVLIRRNGSALSPAAASLVELLEYTLGEAAREFPKPAN
ncbi:MAG TPA: LysR substrate-binding domain-containing protein [Bordetella sp.]|jgi:DNA-binding transcriptional LysR family regulator|nr:LysR substrate-binding domain-containing protein [Bordetella sp.]